MKSDQLPKEASVVWEKVLEILPALKSGEWKKRMGDKVWDFTIHYNTVAGKWKTWHGIPDLPLCEMQILYACEEDEDEGFWLYDDAGTEAELDGEVVSPTYDPVIICKVINEKRTEDWIVANKEKGWSKITGRKYGI